MAITGGDVQSVQNYFAMNELNTHLGALTAQLGKIPGTYGKLGKELAVYSQELANIKAGTGYGDLTDTQKDTFKKVNDTLKTINIAINMIGTYVHTNRLQYVELYSKFYEGGGRAFAPLTANTKYFKLKEEK